MGTLLWKAPTTGVLTPKTRNGAGFHACHFQTFFFQDRLILFFLGWEDNVNEAYLTYTKKDEPPGGWI